MITESSHDALTTFIKAGKVLKTVITCVSAMALNATFNNSSVISWWSVLLIEETRKKTPTCHKSLTTFITLKTRSERLRA